MKTIEDLKKYLKEYFKDSDVKIFLFGSRARGDNSPFSDIDLGFLTNKDISKKMILLKEFLEKSNFPYKTDLVDLTSNKKLLKVVMKEGKRWL